MEIIYWKTEKVQLCVYYNATWCSIHDCQSEIHNTCLIACILHLNNDANIEFHQKPWPLLFIIESIYWSLFCSIFDLVCWIKGNCVLFFILFKEPAIIAFREVLVSLGSIWQERDWAVVFQISGFFRLTFFPFK